MQKQIDCKDSKNFNINQIKLKIMYMYKIYVQQYGQQNYALVEENYSLNNALSHANDYFKNKNNVSGYMIKRGNKIIKKI